MKRIFVAVLIICFALSFFGCKEKETSLKEVTLLIADKDLNELARYQKEAKGTLADLLGTIAEQDSDFSYTTIFSGKFLESVTIKENIGLFPDSGKNEFIAIYHTIDTPEQRDCTIDALTYDGLSFFSAANGIDSTPLVDGASYLIKIVSF